VASIVRFAIPEKSTGSMKEPDEQSLPQPEYLHLLTRISDAFTSGQFRAAKAVNRELVETYWQVGQHIVEFEQAGTLRAEYGKGLLNRLSRDLTL